MAEFNKERVVSILNSILEQELAGVVRYTHYSFLIFGHGRIPIVSWLREQANESLLHAQQAGEMITHLGAYPSLDIGPLLDRHQLRIDDILHEALETEGKAMMLYRALLAAVTGHSVMLEEYARQMIFAEELHAGEVEKMLRRAGSINQELPPEGK
ncbi:ferritin-like domain-containing protein [Novosphingobium album (ex Hu et al. 2023)]|uniref:Bacterioferritin n=1 Tax=Novosphingobium album (ex Hu et al. 2023) TaxID=2930093 RepID=A0ABT0B839_9SPHN|nr:ferritin-like domain-containing protein [Novosphingobium album (ex Hu et al. 2023)]MCJ2181023.1 bacterioferritin [Novosphingobium album (ex Hu et al. 2023)]